jgi:hypothetical protein
VWECVSVLQLLGGSREDLGESRGLRGAGYGNALEQEGGRTGSLRGWMEGRRMGGKIAQAARFNNIVVALISTREYTQSVRLAT